MPEIEEPLIEASPDIHTAASHVVRQVVEVIQAAAFRLWVVGTDPVESVVVDRTLIAIAIDQIEQATADALQCGHVQRGSAGDRIGGLDPQSPRTVVSMRGIDHAKAHRRCARPMERGKACGVRSGLLVHEIVDIALPIDGDRFGAMLGDGSKTHAPKEGMQLHRLWMRKLDECKTVGAHRVLRADGCGRRIVWKRTHAKILFCATKISRIGCKSCAKYGRITGGFE